MRPAAAAAAALCAALALAACGDEDGARSAALDCRGDLPEPTAAAGEKADLALALDGFAHRVVDGRHRYGHTRRFVETGGVGATIYRGRVCVEDGAQCTDACVDYRVPADGRLVQGDHHVATPLDSDRITLEYWARDDAGHLMTLTRTVATDGASARVVE